jgi:hypothetical protein
MTRFRPTVEALDARDLPSAVLADVPAAPPSTAAAQLADLPGQPAPGDDDVSLNFPKITFKTIQVASKVTVQDINFTVTVSKASPKL